MSEYMLIATKDFMGTDVLIFCGMFESREAAQEVVGFEHSYYIVRADQLFWGDNPTLAINHKPTPKESKKEKLE